MEEIKDNEISELDKEIIYLDEELPEIEYYELLSFDEIIENNPNFIALTRREIYNELYELFKNSNKSNNYLELFYDITTKKETDTTNYLLLSDATKIQYSDPRYNDDNDDTPILEFINTFKKINRINDIELAQKEKNKLFFTIEYSDNSTYVRFKPYYKTQILINNEKQKYILHPHNDTNVPVKKINYIKPKSIINEKLSDKILAHFNEEKIIKTVETTDNITNDFNNAKPTIQEILDDLDLNKLKDYESVDYDLILSLLHKYDYNYDNVSKSDYQIINEYVKKITETKIDNYQFKTVRNKEFNFVNNKTNFYNKNSNIFKLLKFNEDINNEHYAIISKLEDAKSSLEQTDLLYNNIYDIVSALYNKDVDLDTIITNLKNIIETQRIDNAINNIKNYSENNLDEIEELFNKEKSKFEKINIENPADYGNILKFINISNELVEIKTSNNNKDYIYVNNTNEEFYDHDNKEDIDDIKDLDYNFYEYNVNLFDKYIEIEQYINAEGFKEQMKILLPILSDIVDKSKLNINYEVLCNKLYKEFSHVSTKYYEIKKKMEEIDKELSDKIIQDLSKINYKKIIKNSDSIRTILPLDFVLSDKLINILIDVNKDYFETIKNVFLNAIAIWILEIQNDIINNVHIHNYNYNYIHLWDDYGFPINKTKKVGVTIYLCDIINSIFQDNEDYEIFNIDLKIIKTITDIIDNKYSDYLNKLIKESEEAKQQTINRNKGKKYQVDLVDNLNKFKTTKTLELKNKMLDNYVKALIYMPGINYNRIHKYLLGCCLQQINKDFASYNDLKDKRKDLIAAKTYFSKTKQNIKKQQYYLPIGEEYLESEEEVDDFVNLNHNISVKTDLINYVNWFKKQEDGNLFTKENYNNIKQNGSGEYIKIVKNYIKYYCNTIGNNKSNLHKLLVDNINKINFKIIANNVIKILSQMCYEENTEPDDILLNVISNYNYLFKKFNELDDLYDTNSLTDILRAKCYVIVKIISLPYNADVLIGEKMDIIYGDGSYDKQKYAKIAKLIHDKIIKVIEASIMPTYEENIEFISKMREEFKNKRLELYDKLNEDQRKVFNELSKIGIKIEKAIAENDVNINDDDTNYNGEMTEYNGENEYVMNGNNDDQHHDDLDNDDYGHIYDD